jgi:GR25 family glycosyltransferase involved in LPS biosynthesis
VPENIFYNAGYENLKDESKYKTENPNIWIAHQTWSTGCMIISRSGAEKILNYIYDGINLPLDIFILGGSTLRNPKKNDRILNVYSLSKNATRITSLKEYPSQIQNGKYVRQYIE